MSGYRHSVCRWCFGEIPLEELCQQVTAMGYESIELTGPEEWPVLQQYGLTCAIATFPQSPEGIGTIEKAFNRLENHDVLEKLYCDMIPRVAAAGIAAGRLERAHLHGPRQRALGHRAVPVRLRRQDPELPAVREEHHGARGGR